MSARGASKDRSYNEECEDINIVNFVANSCSWKQYICLHSNQQDFLNRLIEWSSEKIKKNTQVH